MTRVFVDVGVSLDGYMAGPNRSPANPMGGAALSLHSWMFATATFRAMLQLPPAPPSPDDPIVAAVFARTGANVLGRRMFDEGEVSWPEEAPFHAPVFVLTHHAREPWVRPGGTTFHFVTDGALAALARAKEAAGGKDVRISGGAETIREYLYAGLVDEITLHIAPVLIGDGLRLLDGLKPGLVLEQRSVVVSSTVTHITYEVVKGPR